MQREDIPAWEAFKIYSLAFLRRIMSQKVAIIGAGVAGLTALKTALESGLEATAFERDSQIGGLWNCPDKTKARHSCVQISTVTNTSKHMTCFSDFPMPIDWPNYLCVPKLMEYLEMYADHFKLMNRIHLNTTIVELKQTPCHNETGKWEVSHRTKDGEVKSEIFDAVMVCTGINSEPLVPDIPGQENFKGRILHSLEYHTFQPFEGKRVVVVGNGNTGGDISCELSRHASQVYLSARCGVWVASRLYDGGCPSDLVLLTRANQLVPKRLLGHMMKWKLEQKFSHANFGLESVKPPDLNFPIINDELPHRIVTGSITVKSEISYVEDKTIIFKDGTRVEGIDAIILATGFEMSVPVLPKSLQPTQGSIPFYKYVFPPSLKHSTLAIIGAMRVGGAIPPVVELQARWAVQVFIGNCTLPSAGEMRRDVEATKAAKLKKFGFNKFLNLVSFVPYTDEIASLAGVNPNLWSLLLEDPHLALRCYFGPCIPAQYRLRGPGSWEGAKDVINNIQESTLAPLRTRKVAGQPQSDQSKWKIIFVSLLVLFFAILCYWK